MAGPGRTSKYLAVTTSRGRANGHDLRSPSKKKKLEMQRQEKFKKKIEVKVIGKLEAGAPRIPPGLSFLEC